MERTGKASAIKWFRKSFSKRDESPSKSFSSNKIMRWFTRSTVATSPLQREVDVVPKTEITASRQTLNNINLALNSAESSGETSGNLHEKGVSSSKYCCDEHVESERADNDESIKCSKNSKSPLIDKLCAADSARSIDDNETECRRPIGNVKNRDYIIFLDPCVDYGRLECPDSHFPSLVDIPTAHHGRYVQLKNNQQRHYSSNYDLFTTIDKLETIEKDKSELNYKLLSDIERRLDASKYNLFNCRAYNKEYRKISGCDEIWPLEDFNDDAKSTRMNEDTRTIKEYFRLSIESDVLIHFQDLKVETGQAVESHSRGFLNFFTWLLLRGKEITEEHKTKDFSLINTIANFFKNTKKTKSKLEGSKA